MDRYNPNIDEGLNSNQVNNRKIHKLTNKYESIKTKSILDIIKDNIFTIFNLVNFILGLMIILVGSYKNLLFLGIVVCNTLISIIQEIRSKLVVDKLKVIASTKVNVIRNSKIKEIDIHDIVLDDILLLKPGNQIVADAIIKEGIVTVNESFITGETDLITYKKGNLLKSGSFIVSGTCKAKVEHVGLDNYINKISKDAKYVKPINSVIMITLNKIIKFISFIIFPLGIILFLNQYNLNNNLEASVVNTVAALIGMIPEGLILLTSTVLAVSVIRLSKINVLVKELYCIENLARIDTICLDKTGTITTGNMEVKEVITLNKKYNIEEIMGNFINNTLDDNATIKALKKYYKKYDNYHFIKNIPFSSEIKYSGVYFKEGNFLLGAPEYLTDKKIKEVIDNQDDRVLLLCLEKEPIAVIILKDEIRKTAKQTLEYLNNQGVNIKIISGDNVKTVKSIAKQVGIKELKCVDLTNVDNLEESILNNNIFGRVKPLQKKKIIEILQKNNHYVAMTGDGVNDVLALKQADCSISIKNATDAARNVSQLILLNDDFDSVPNIIKEGRRTINNITRSATLFLAKTGYALLLALVFMFVNFKYPFEPIQLTLTNFFTIGFPSFVLALEPNNNLIKGKFLTNILTNSMPTSLTITADIVLITLIGNLFKFTNGQISTMCVIITAFTGFLLLFKISYPLNKLRLTLIITLTLGFIGVIFGFKQFFVLTFLNFKMLIFMILMIILSLIMFSIMTLISDKIIKKYVK